MVFATNVLLLATAIASCSCSMSPKSSSTASTSGDTSDARGPALTVCPSSGSADAPRVEPRDHRRTNVSEIGTGKRPHVVLVIMDDVGWNGLRGFNGGVSGDQYPSTPSFDAAIAEGIRLQNLYVQPMCSPTRAAVMTGRFPHRYGAQSFVQRPYQPTFMPEDETTLADKLLAAGYHTSLVGKWHLGYGLRKYTPTARGFRHFFGSYEVGGDHFTHTVGIGTHALGAAFAVTDGNSQTLDLHRERSATGRQRDSHEHVVDRNGIYSSEMLAQEAISEIDVAADAGQPLFLYVAFLTIHTPLQVPAKYVSANAHIRGSSEARTNAGMMTAMDTAFGEIVAKLKSRDMWKDTVLACFSDNGAMISQGASNFPLRGQKMGPFEGGIRSVGFVSGGRQDIRNAAGSVYNGLLHAVDVHSLLLHAAGADAGFSRSSPKKLDAEDGMALWRSVTSSPGALASVRSEFVALLDPLGQIPWINAAMGWTLLGKCAAIRSGKWKLLHGYPGRDDWYPGDPGKCFRKLAHEGTIPDPPLEHPECVRGDLHYDTIDKGFRPKDTWLFDIDADPNERRDLSSSEPDVVERLKARIAQEYATAAPPFPDRWSTAIGMMEGIFHELNPGGGYSAGLTSWMEPDHLKNVGCCRRARQWLRIRVKGRAVDLKAHLAVRSSRAPKALLSPELVSSAEQLLSDAALRELDDGVRRSLGLEAEAPLTSDILAKLEAQAELIETGIETAQRAFNGHDSAAASVIPQSRL